MSYVGVVIVSFIISMYFSFQRRKGFSPNLLILKVVSSLSFLLCGYAAICIANSNHLNLIYGITILFGGILGLCGDIFLDLKGIYNEHKDLYLKFGFVSFFICHIFYNLAIIKSNFIDIKWVLLCVAISLILGFINISLDKVFKIEYGSYKWIVFAYSAIMILTTVTSVFSLILNGFSFSRLFMLIGGILFIVSDVILSYTFFKAKCDGPNWYLINHITYYVAQLLIMSSICIDKLVF